MAHDVITEMGEDLAEVRLAELRWLRQRYVSLLNTYALERRDRVRYAGLTNTEANMVEQATRERWAL